VVSTRTRFQIKGLTGNDGRTMYGMADAISLNEQQYEGIKNAYEFNPDTERYEEVAPMQYARWYPTLSPLPDGRVLTVSGLDGTGAVLPGVTVEAASATLVGRVRSAVTDNSGAYRITGLPGGQYSLTFTLAGFTIAKHESINIYGAQAASVNATLSVGSVTETVTVSGASPMEPPPPPALLTFDSTRSLDRDERRADAPQFVAPSSNVVNLQRRTAGVLPIRLDVPRAGTSLQFVKPLVVDQEVNVTLRYKRRG
jgi:hypothetical protein